MTTYPAERLWEEVVYVAYYLHWSHAEILDLEHSTRARVIEGIGRIHTKLDESDPALAPAQIWR
ncbi:DUF6760 family protein [Kribbella sp. NBC_01505]|uniref:DUF6760 family protein n=1 Tax=Kribbella sp. NBC_01505 TaxID=2903580 RepID=UPI00386B811F